jgi:hypothetical protein
MYADQRVESGKNDDYLIQKFSEKLFSGTMDYQNQKYQPFHPTETHNQLANNISSYP